jgi:hypothetical protein
LVTFSRPWRRVGLSKKERESKKIVVSDGQDICFKVEMDYLLCGRGKVVGSFSWMIVVFAISSSDLFK